MRFIYHFADFGFTAAWLKYRKGTDVLNSQELFQFQIVTKIGHM